MRLAGSYLRSTAGRMFALSAGIGAAAAAFAVLGIYATAPTVQIRGKLPPDGSSRVFQILVSAPRSARQHSDAATLTRPADLTDMSGGITLAQYNLIRRLPGVQEAAPMTMVGYVPLTVSMTLTIRATTIGRSRRLFGVTALLRSDGALSTLAQRTIGGAYVSGPITPRGVGASRPGGGRRRARGLVSVPVQLRWIFLLPLVAVDPAAEAGLLHLNRAVIRGSYLPDVAGAQHAPIPVIMASSIDYGEQCTLSVAEVSASAARLYAKNRTTRETKRLLAASARHPVGTTTITGAQAYQLLLRSSNGAAATVVPVPVYWTTTPARYTLSAAGDLVPRPVGSGASSALVGPYLRTAVTAASPAGQEIAFAKLMPHVAARAAASPPPAAGAALTTVGIFDPAEVTTAPAALSPYVGERLAAADAASRALLGGQPLEPAGPASYPSAGASLVMPLQDIGAFAGYTGANGAAPIGSIRVRVAGGSAGDALSRERVRAVATEIVRATGLDVRVVFAAAPVTRTIDLAVGTRARQALHVREVWYRLEPHTSVRTVLDPRRVSLGVLALIVGVAFVAYGGRAALPARGSEVMTLRALGWRRRQLGRQVLANFAPVALASGVFAYATASIAAAVGHHSSSAWPQLAGPAAFAMTIAGAWWPVRWATQEPEPVRRLPAGWQPHIRLPAGWQPHIRLPAGWQPHIRLPVRWLQPAPLRTGGAVVIAMACAAVGEELAVRWAFGGLLVGLWLGRAVSWPADATDALAAISILAMAMITLVGLYWLSGIERVGELRTLLAIGWPAHRVAGLLARKAAYLGLAGGATAAVVDTTGTFLVVHRLPIGLLAAAAATMAIGLLMSLVAAGVSMIIGRATGALRLSHRNRSVRVLSGSIKKRALSLRSVSIGP